MGRTSEQGKEDHDLLIEIKTELRLLREVIANSNKELSMQLGDHEARLRNLEKQRWMIVGAASAIATLLNIILKILVV